MFKEIASQHQLDLIQEKVKTAKRIVVVGHQNPDGDAMGAVLGFCCWAQLRNTDANIKPVMPDAYPDFLQWLPCSNTIIRFDKKPEMVKELAENADLLVCLDFNDYTRVGVEMEPCLRSFKGKVIHIDHHITPAIDADVSISDVNASSTSEMVLKIVMQLGDFDDLNSKFYIPIFTGMMTDTGNFAYANATADTYFLVSRLLAKGVDKVKVCRNVYDNFSFWRLRLMGYVLNKKLVHFPTLHASYFTLTRTDLCRYHFIKGDAEGIVNMPLQIKGQKLSISLREDTQRDNLIWVSTRSAYDFPCNELCQRFYNGGGHRNASGGRLNCSIEEAVKITEEAIKYYADMLKTK